ncbi:hypothetical protein ACUHMQ_12700 [Chitinimonas sp. PSY-7]|uniref:hypothetical protein n=1 Tax=Chitinimonas sp. PSY-7 TaxID=3459088 RepID=UPI00403FFCC1
MHLEQQEQLAERLASLPPQWVAGFPISLDEEGVVGRFFKCELRSIFEAIQVGDCTMARATLVATGPDGEPFPTERLFRLASGEDGLLKLDRLCRLIHSLNHFVVANQASPLVLPIHPRLFEYVRSGHGNTFSRLLAHFDLSPQHIVLEVPASVPQTAVEGYQHEGFGVRRVSDI